MKPFLSITVIGVNRRSIGTENRVPSDKVSLGSCVEHLASGGEGPTFGVHSQEVVGQKMVAGGAGNNNAGVGAFPEK